QQREKLLHFSSMCGFRLNQIHQGNRPGNGSICAHSYTGTVQLGKQSVIYFGGGVVVSVLLPFLPFFPPLWPFLPPLWPFLVVSVFVASSFLSPPVEPPPACAKDRLAVSIKATTNTNSFFIFPPVIAAA